MLVADDDPILREFATVHLATPTVEVEVAEDGVVALEMLKAGGFDIALVDLDMPRMDGFELIRHIRADEVLKHLPLVVVTGREDMVAVDRAYAEGATSFVVKPLNWRVLSHQLAYVLRNCRAEATLRDSLNAVKTLETRKSEVLQASLTAIAAAARRIEAATQDAGVRAGTQDIARLSEAVQRLHGGVKAV
ncbi:MAG: response regulator [Asticcacaulis sp.]